MYIGINIPKKCLEMTLSIPSGYHGRLSHKSTFTSGSKGKQRWCQQSTTIKPLSPGSSLIVSLYLLLASCPLCYTGNYLQHTGTCTLTQYVLYNYVTSWQCGKGRHMPGHCPVVSAIRKTWQSFTQAMICTLLHCRSHSVTLWRQCIARKLSGLQERPRS